MSTENRKSTLGKIAQTCMAYALFGVLSSLLLIYAEPTHAQSSNDRVPGAEQARTPTTFANRSRTITADERAILSRLQEFFVAREKEKAEKERQAQRMLAIRAGESVDAPVADQSTDASAPTSLVLASADIGASYLWNSTRDNWVVQSQAHLYAIFCESSKHPARTKGCEALFARILDTLWKLRIHDAESVKNAVEEYKRIYDIID